ncbi:conserved hypothetical protein [Trichinella spiralis]|uniref:hypothetical protein n=1 Tax=Trichinella spiralis TaxID=6334 RepID=UPI0001EFD221|nr:conserved hypothetical protein [Trichinella spiralis]
MRSSVCQSKCAMQTKITTYIIRLQKAEQIRPTAHMPPLTVGSCTPSIKGRSVCPTLIIGNKQLHNIETTAIGPQVPFGNIESCGVMTPCVLDCRKCSRELRKPCGKWLCGPGLEICSRGNHC